MKRLHVHVGVTELDDSIDYYSTLFGAAPSVLKTDYAKWDLADPPVNFTITQRIGEPGIRHLGIETENDEELTAIRADLAAAGQKTFDEDAAQCCYAVSDKSWSTDPAGIRWEAFHSLEQADDYGADTAETAEGDACCAPKAAVPPDPRNLGGCC